MKASTPRRPRVVILGAGFAGLHAARNLAWTRADVVLVDQTNHHLFQPLLYQVGTGALSPANISRPIRSILRKPRNVSICMDEVERIDLDGKKVIGSQQELSYDYLIVATGARHSYFGHPEWEEFAPGLKTLEDALEIRRKIFASFEAAELMTDPEARKAALTFVIIGAGPTGVEMAGAMSEIAFMALPGDYRNFDPADSRLILVDALDRVLPTFHPDISKKAHRKLEALGIEIRLGTMVKDVTGEGVQAGDDFIPARTVIWAAGNQASPILGESGIEVDKAGRAVVREDLSVQGHPEVQVLGDAALFTHQTGEPLPALASVAMQQGKHAAWNIRRAILGWPSRKFKYSDRGTMATIGRHAAVADLRGLRFNGRAAWLLWLAVHIFYLSGNRNRLLVLLKWWWSFLSCEKEERLIVERCRPGERAKGADPNRSRPEVEEKEEAGRKG